jgi:hypothetical protein
LPNNNESSYSVILPNFWQLNTTLVVVFNFTSVLLPLNFQFLVWRALQHFTQPLYKVLATTGGRAAPNELGEAILQMVVVPLLKIDELFPNIMGCLSVPDPI